MIVAPWRENTRSRTPAALELPYWLASDKLAESCGWEIAYRPYCLYDGRWRAFGLCDCDCRGDSLTG